MVYPQQFTQTHSNERYEDITTEPLNKGIERMQKFGKGLSNIFRKGQ